MLYKTELLVWFLLIYYLAKVTLNFIHQDQLKNIYNGLTKIYNNFYLPI